MSLLTDSALREEDGIASETMRLWDEFKELLKIASQHPLMGAIASFLLVDAMGKIQTGWDEKTYVWRSSAEGPPPA